MGCNCSKNKRQPTGFAKPSNAQQEAQRDGAAKASRDERAARGKLGGGRTQTFELKTVSGKTMTFNSRLEAQAEKVRAGGGSIRQTR